MSIRIVLLLVIAASMVPAAIASRSILLGEVVGASLGIALGLWGAARTRYVTHDGELNYLPHTYTGLAVTALFLGRLAYRVMTLYTTAPAKGGAGPGPAQGFAPSSMVQSPLTVAIFFVLVGYYVVYYGVVLYKSKRLKPADLEPQSSAAS